MLYWSRLQLNLDCVYNLSHIVGLGNPMRKDRFNLCPAPQGGLIPQRSNFQTGHRLKRFFIFLSYMMFLGTTALGHVDRSGELSVSANRGS